MFMLSFHVSLKSCVFVGMTVRRIVARYKFCDWTMAVRISFVMEAIGRCGTYIM